ncbi:MAG TPA: tyrosine-type recombinase/integrase [Balneolales bacterium]|nr:tyrosine-type recombinase/integrase [Balneolales bacterium]
MSFLQKRGKTWYARFNKIVDGQRKEIKFSLKTRQRPVAVKRLEELQAKFERKEIDPFAPSFDLESALREDEENPEPWTLDDSLEMLLDSKKHRKKRTRQIYVDIVGYFLSFNNLNGKPINAVTKEHFLKFLYRPEISTTTRYTDRQHLGGWWRFLMKNGWVQKDLVSNIDLPQKDARVLPKMITEDELEKLFKAFDKKNKERRKNKYHRSYFEQPWFKPVIITLVDAGLRIHECLYNPYQAARKEDNYTGLKGRNLIGDLEYIYIDKAKRNRERMIPITSRLRKYLKQYFKVRGVPGPDDYVFITYRGQPIVGHHARKEFKEYLRMAGIPDTRTFHGMRHRAITTWLEEGFTLSEAKDMAGHSSVKITDEVYTHLAAKNLKRKMERIEAMKKKESGSK